MPPNLLQKYTQEQQIIIKYNPKQTATENWEYAKNIIHETIWKIYPSILQNEENIGKQGIWICQRGGESKITQLKHERRKIQQTLTKNDTKLHRPSNKLNLLKFPMRGVTRRNSLKKRQIIYYIILYDREPIIDKHGAQIQENANPWLPRPHRNPHRPVQRQQTNKRLCDQQNPRTWHKHENTVRAICTKNLPTCKTNCEKNTKCNAYSLAY